MAATFDNQVIPSTGRRFVGPLIILAMALMVMVMSSGAAHGASVDGRARFVPLVPARIIDTRDSTGINIAGPLPAGSTTAFQITGRGGVPAEASAVLLNLTGVNAVAPGFVTVWPTGSGQPTVSNLNLSGPKDIEANQATVRLGQEGQLNVYALMQTDFVADVMGYYVPTADPVSDGRFVPLTPSRILDTREGNGAPAGIVASGGVINLQVAGRGGVPASGVEAVSLNVTMDQADPGFLRVWPTGAAMPDTSVDNPTTARPTVPNAVTVKVGDNGQISLYTLQRAHLIVDVSGYYTDATAGPSTDGLYVPLNPVRFLDTRQNIPFTTFGAGDTEFIRFGGLSGIPTDGVAALLFNLTGTNAAGPGFVTVYPPTSARPVASNLNLVGRGDTKANTVLVQTGPSINVAIYTLMRTDLVVDLAGYFTGPNLAVDEPQPTPITTPEPPITNQPPPVITPAPGCRVSAVWGQPWGQLSGAPETQITVVGGTVSWSTTGTIHNWSAVTDNTDSTPYIHPFVAPIPQTGSYIAPSGNIVSASFCIV